MRKTIRVVFSVVVMTGSTEALAENLPFIGKWGEYFTKAPEGCIDPAAIFEISETEINGCIIKKIEHQGDWFLVTSRCADGAVSEDALSVQGDELTMQSVTDPQIKSTQFTYPRCQ